MFLNLKDGILSVRTYREPGAIVSQDDLYKSFLSKESNENLTAIIKSKLKFLENEKIAVFTGLSGSEEFCFEEEAHNIDSLEEAAGVWGVDLEDSELEIEID